MDNQYRGVFMRIPYLVCTTFVPAAESRVNKSQNKDTRSERENLYGH